jgi:hypothetical protein
VALEPNVEGPPRHVLPRRSRSSANGSALETSPLQSRQTRCSAKACCVNLRVARAPGPSPAAAHGHERAQLRRARDSGNRRACRWTDVVTRGELTYLGSSELTEPALVCALVRLPEEVRTFGLERCRFLSVGQGALGCTVPGRVGVDDFTKRTRNVWIILLEDDPPENEPLESTIAHEVAHAWSGHDFAEPHDARQVDPFEVDAATLARSWGFEGPAADPDEAPRRHARAQSADS